MNLERVRKELADMAHQLDRLLREEFRGEVDPVVCVAEGHLQAAHAALVQAGNLL